MPESATKRPNARAKLLDAAVEVVRTKGLHATTVDDLCAAAGVTKGAFFHHFLSKDDLAVAAADYWSETTGRMFASAPYHDAPNAADRVLGYLDFRAELIQGAAPEYTCLAGTMVQEAFSTNHAIRDACGASILGHADTLVDDIAKALQGSPTAREVSAVSVARHTQAVLQGSFVLSKAADDRNVALDSIDHLRRYLRFLFNIEAHDRDGSDV